MAGSETQLTYYDSITITDEDIKKARWAICGARACQGAKDAKIVLEALGILPGKEEVPKGVQKIG